MQIPASSDELNANWATSAMRATGQIGDNDRVASLTIEGLDGGLAMSGETCRVRFVYEPGSRGPSSAVAKFCSSNPTMKGLLETLDVYAREISFYRDLSHRLPIRAPQFVGGDFDPAPKAVVRRAGTQLVDFLPLKAQLAITADVTRFAPPSKRRYALLIEDIPGAKVHGLLSPPSDEQLATVLTHLARVHAKFWGQSELRKHPATGRVLTQTPRLYANVCQHRCVDLARNRWEWFNDDQAALVEAATSTMRRDVAAINTPLTLVHGDPRSDNFLFTDDGVVIVDWSLTGFAHPGFDVGYLLAYGWDGDPNGDGARDLVRHYQQALRAEGRVVDFDEIWAMAQATGRTLVVQLLLGLEQPMTAYDDEEDHRSEDHSVARVLNFLASA